MGKTKYEMLYRICYGTKKYGKNGRDDVPPYVYRIRWDGEAGKCTLCKENDAEFLFDVPMCFQAYYCEKCLWIQNEVGVGMMIRKDDKETELNDYLKGVRTTLLDHFKNTPPVSYPCGYFLAIGLLWMKPEMCGRQLLCSCLLETPEDAKVIPGFVTENLIPIMTHKPEVVMTTPLYQYYKRG